MSYSINIELFHDESASKSNARDLRTGPLKAYGIDLEPVPKGEYLPAPSEHDLGFGVVHLYRDPKEVDIANSARIDGDDGTILAILAVPSYFTPSDFLGFVGDETRANVSHFRMIRTASPNRYMVLMKFYKNSGAEIFLGDYNGRLFNSMEAETCHVVHIKSIYFQSQNAPPASFSFLLDDPFSPDCAPLHRDIAASSAAVGAKPIAPRTPALQELPTCVVCLERMDASVTGLLTILCQHSFHCACLRKWSDASCPICRYSQKRHGRDRLEGTTMCGTCNSVHNLWACLICGHIGCGRYDAAHAYGHYKETSHCYAMDIDTQRVWDYAGDGYVHRLIQNKADGKVVELPSAWLAIDGSTDSRDSSASQEKLNDVSLEYVRMLSLQLDSQRAFFEDKVAAAADKAVKATERAESLEQQNHALEAEILGLETDNNELRSFILPDLTKQKDRVDRKVSKLRNIADSLEKQWNEEESMNRNLVEKIHYHELKNRELQCSIVDLNEQLKDVMFFLGAQNTLSGTEAEGGTASIGSSKTNKKTRK